MWHNKCIKTTSCVFRQVYSLTLYRLSLTVCWQSRCCSTSFSTLGTGGVSWWSRLVPVWGDAASAEPVSTAGRDRILQDVLTPNTAGRLLLHRSMTPLLSVKTFLVSKMICWLLLKKTLHATLFVAWFKRKTRGLGSCVNKINIFV